MSLEYKDKIFKAFDEFDEMRAGEIFDFNFSKAYVFSDDYMSGDLFADEYDLDISISEVKEETTGASGRIVFVDENGDFVFTFTYKKETMYFEKCGLVIYPDTKIAKSKSKDDSALVLSLDSTEYFYRSRNPQKYTNSLLKYFDSDEVIQANNIFHFGYSVFCEAMLLENEEKIVFYDEDGVLMYEYTYNAEQLMFEEVGIVIYPNDSIIKCGQSASGIPIFKFSGEQK